jgi:hypothetical protein
VDGSKPKPLGINGHDGCHQQRQIPIPSAGPWPIHLALIFEFSVPGGLRHDFSEAGTIKTNKFSKETNHKELARKSVRR